MAQRSACPSGREQPLLYLQTTAQNMKDVRMNKFPEGHLLLRDSPSDQTPLPLPLPLVCEASFDWFHWASTQA